ncbi:hypothetical protein AKO1_014921 [Acrasis kona]|uniref:Uncharacterized protein n=1 Tax=Acrasis kona TaxID=1008807 RepID=A0AAW2Z0S8_9EUKA
MSFDNACLLTTGMGFPIYDTLLSPPEVTEEPFLVLQPPTLFPDTTVNVTSADLDCLPQGIQKQPFEVGDWTVDEMIFDTHPSLFSCTIRTRDSEEDQNVVPSTQYSTIVYQMNLKLNSSTIPFAINKIGPSMLAAKIRIVDTENLNVVNSQGNPVVELTPDQDLIPLEFAKKSHFLVATVKYKLTEVSYHFKNKNFFFLISVHYLANDNNVVLFNARSTGFLSRARRPNKKDRHDETAKPIARSGHKRRREETETLEKKTRVQYSTNNNVDPFSCVLPHTFAGVSRSPAPLEIILRAIESVKDKLSEEQKYNALNIMKDKFCIRSPASVDFLCD